jgi:hypothetical protein
MKSGVRSESSAKQSVIGIYSMKFIIFPFSNSFWNQNYNLAFAPLGMIIDNLDASMICPLI